MVQWDYKFSVFIVRNDAAHDFRIIFDYVRVVVTHRARDGW